MSEYRLAYVYRLYPTKAQEMALSVRTHRCCVCGLVLDRDTNAAINILSVGQHRVAVRTA